MKYLKYFERSLIFIMVSVLFLILFFIYDIQDTNLKIKNLEIKEKNLEIKNNWEIGDTLLLGFDKKVKIYKIDTLRKKVYFNYLDNNKEGVIRFDCFCKNLSELKRK